MTVIFKKWNVPRPHYRLALRARHILPEMNHSPSKILDPPPVFFGLYALIYLCDRCCVEDGTDLSASSELLELAKLSGFTANAQMYIRQTIEGTDLCTCITVNLVTKSVVLHLIDIIPFYGGPME